VDGDGADTTSRAKEGQQNRRGGETGWEEIGEERGDEEGFGGNAIVIQ
jgi:hypothetical protein